MADKNIIDAMWDDSPVDVSTEVKATPHKVHKLEIKHD